MLVLDTDHLSLLERPNSMEGQRLRQRLDPVPATERGSTIVNFEEQSRGWLAYVKNNQAPNQLVTAFYQLRKHLRNYCEMTVLDFDEPAAERLDRLIHQRLRIGTKDFKSPPSSSLATPPCSPATSGISTAFPV